MSLTAFVNPLNPPGVRHIDRLFNLSQRKMRAYTSYKSSRKPFRKPRFITHTPSASASSFPSPPDATPFSIDDTIISTYKITSLLGSGASGTTYKALVTTGPSRGTFVALKALSLRTMQSWKGLELFQREARALQSLSHPAIPSYIDSFEVDHSGDRIFVLVQRIADGDSLQALLDDGRRFSTDQAVSIFQQLLSVLRYLASFNPPVLHRDVKPANVILDLSGSTPALSLVDFGGVNANVVPQSGGMPSATLVGTYGYMAPEQFSGVADVRTDLYAAGATILTMLTGLAPSAISQKRLKVDLESVIPVREQLKLGNVYTVMSKLLEPAPEDRYDSAADALDALQGISLSSMRSKSVSDKAPSVAAKRDTFLDVRNTALSDEEIYSLERAFINMSASAEDPPANALEKLTAWTSKKLRKRKPVGTRVDLARDRTNRLLRISIPPKGFSGDVLVKGLFTLTWTGFTAFWTVGVLTGGAPAVFSLFSIPFWAAGARLAKTTANEVTGVTTLVVSFGGGQKEIFYFGLSSKGAFGRGNFVEGDARDLDGARVDTEMYVNGRPVTELYLREGTRRHAIGGALEPVEQEWVRDEINDFLNAKRR